METYPEHDPLPIQLRRPELEIAWRGLLYSVEAGYLTRDEAVITIKEWDNGETSTILPHVENERACSSEAE